MSLYDFPWGRHQAALSAGLFGSWRSIHVDDSADISSRPNIALQGHKKVRFVINRKAEDLCARDL